MIKQRIFQDSVFKLVIRKLKQIDF